VANLIKYGAIGALTLAIRGDATAPTLKNLANNARVLSDEISTRDILSDWRLRVRLAVAPTAGRLVLAWFVIDVGDNNEYEDGDSATEGLKAPDLLFPVRAVTTQQVIAVRGIRKPNTPFKVLVRNDTGQAFTNVDNESQLHWSAYNDEIQ
jgi:hypothetical protein